MRFQDISSGEGRPESRAPVVGVRDRGLRGILMIPAIWNYFVGYAVGTAIAVIGLYIAFILPVWLRWRSGDSWDEPAHGASAGTTSGSTIAILWVGIITILSSSRCTRRPSVGGRLLAGSSRTTRSSGSPVSALVFGGWWFLRPALVQGAGAHGHRGGARALEEEQRERFELPTEAAPTSS